jgi:hypothetical protein
MAELMFCLSIIPHMRSFDVPPKLSPAHAGLFLRRSTQKEARDRHWTKIAFASGIISSSVPITMSGNRFRRVDLAFYLFLTLMSILAVIATAVSCWPVR